MQCAFEIAWVGQCTNNAINNSNMCKKHAELKCVSCGNPATHECPETMGLVCGELLCDDCEHTICSNGCNSGAPRPDGFKAHCKKDQQLYKPWYMIKTCLLCEQDIQHSSCDDVIDVKKKERDGEEEGT